MKKIYALRPLLLSVALILFVGAGARAQTTIAFQGGEAGNCWTFTPITQQAGAPLVGVVSDGNQRTGGSSIRIGGGSQCQSGSGNGCVGPVSGPANNIGPTPCALLNGNVFETSQINVAAYRDPRIQAFTRTMPGTGVCAARVGFDLGDIVTYEVSRNGAPYNVEQTVNGNNNLLWTYDLTNPTQGSFSYTAPAAGCTDRLRFRITVNTNRGDEIISIDDVSLTFTEGRPITASTMAICQGESVTFTADACVVADGNWDFQWLLNGTPIPGETASTFTTTTLAPGDQVAVRYIPTATAENGGCVLPNADSAPITVTVTPIPTVTIAPAGPLNLCVGQTQVLTASGAVTYVWTPATDLSAVNVAAPTLTAATLGTRTYTVTGTDAGCTNSAEVTVTVNANPTVNASAAPTPICFDGSTSVLDATGAATYSWTPAADLDDPTLPDPVFTPSASGTTTFTVVGTSAAGCTASATTSVTVNPVPTVNTSATPAGLCFDGVSTSQLQGTGATGYVWTPAANLSNAAIANPVFTPPSVGSFTYTVTGTDANGCTNSASTTITVGNVPAVVANAAPTTICFDGSQSFLSAVGATTYTWTPVADLNDPNISDPVFTPSAPGTVTFTVVGTTSGCTNSATVSVTVNAVPNLAPTATPSTLCFDGSTSQFQANDAVNYSWSPNFNLSNPSIPNPLYSPNAAGTFTYTVTGDNAAGCTASATVSVTVNPVPNVTANANPVTLCLGSGTSQLQANGANSYVWTPGAGLSNANIANPVFTPPGTGVFNFTVTGTDGNGCTNSAAISITVNPVPVVNVSANSTLICEGSAEALLATGGVIYSWSPTTDLDDPNIPDPVFTPTSSGSFTFTVTVTDASGCTNTGSITIVVNPLPNVTASATPAAICFDGSTSQLQGNGAVTYTWAPAVSLSNANIANPVFTPVGTGVFNYTVTGTDANGCVNDATVAVTVNALPTVTATATPATLCFDGSTSQLQGNGANAYVWTPAANLNNAAISNPVFTPAAAGVATYTVTGTDGNGCTNSAQVSITVNALPAVAAVATPATLCFDGSNSLLEASGANSYVWTPAANLDDPLILDPVFTPPSAGTFTFTVTGTDGNGCTNSATTTVTVNNVPTVTATATPSEVCFDGSISQLQGNGAVNYAWTPATDLNNAAIANPVFTPSAIGTFNYTVTGTDANGCTNSAQVSVTVNPLPVVNALAVPTVLCFDGSTSQLTAGGANTYSWLPAGDLNNALIFNPVFTPSAPGVVNFTVTGTDANGCQNTAAVSVTVNNVPTLNPSATPAAVCFDGSTSQLDVTGANTYVWTAAANLSNANIANPVFTPVAAGTRTFTVTGTDGNGCTNSATTTVTVNALPTVTATATPATICFDGSTSQLQGNGANTYVWSPAANLSNAAIANPVFTPAAAGVATYTVTGTDGNGCTNSAQVSVTVNALPNVTASATPASLCFDGSTSQLQGNGANTYSWTPAADLNNAAIANPVFTPSAPGVVNFTVTGTDGNGCQNTANVSVTVNDVPTINASATPASICFDGSTSQFDATGTSVSYVWSPAIGLGDPLVASPTFFAFNVGTFTYTVTGTDANGCTNSAQVSVTVNDLPTLQAAANPPAICFDGLSTSQLNVQGTAVNYVWAPAANLDDPNIFNPTFTPAAAGTFTFTVTGTDPNGCTNSTQVSVTVNALPTITGTASPDPLCLGGGSTLVAAGGVTYTWAPPAGLSDPNIANPVFTPTAAGNFNFTITGTDVNGCTNTGNLSLTVNSCTFAFTCANDDYFQDFDNWDPNTPTGNTCAAGDQVGWNNGNTIPTWFTDLVSGTYRFNSSDGGCNTGSLFAFGNNGSGERSLGTLRSASNHSRIGATFVNNTGAPITELVIDYVGEQWRRGNTLGNPDRLAFEFSLDATSLSTGTWNPFPALDFLSPITTNPPPAIRNGNVAPNRTAISGVIPVNIPPGATFWIRWDDVDIAGADDGLGVDDVRVRINTLQQPVTVTNSLPLCAGTDVTLTANPAPAAPIDYRWYDVATGGAVLGTGQNFTVTAPAAGNYTFFVEAFNTVTNCKSNLPRTSITFTVNALPNVTAFAPSPICADGTSQITANGAVNYTWLPIAGLSDPAIANPVFTPPGAGNFAFTVTGTDANNCVNTAAVNITVNALPTVTATADNPICIYQTSLLTGGGAAFYTWNPTVNLNNPNIATPTFTPTIDGNFTYTVTGVDANGCQNTAQTTIRVVPRPTVAATATPQTICADATSQLEGTGAVTYAWTPAADLNNPNIALPVFDPPTAGFYQYTVTGTDADGCSNSAQVTVQVNPLPVVTASANPDLICFGTTSQFTASGATSYQWAPTTNLSSTTTASPVFTGNAAGVFPYTVTGTNVFGCQATATVNIEVIPQVIVNVPAVTLCEYETRQLNATGANAYSWFPATNLSANNVPSPTFTPTAPGTFTYTVTGTDGNGCTGSSTVIVTVNPRPTLQTTVQTPVCVNNPSQFTVTGAVNYVWTPPANLNNANISTPTFTSATPGVFPYQVEGTDANGCVNTANVTVTVQALPTIVPLAIPPTICMTGASQLQAVGAATYSWAPAANLNNANVSNPVYTPTAAGTVTFTVTGTSPIGCVNTATVTVTTNPQPIVAAVSAPATICRNQTSQLTANGAATYLWQPGSLSGAAVNVTPQVTTTYTVVGIDANGCTNSATTTVTVNQLPVVTATATPAAICQGLSTQLSTTGAVNYVWNPGNLIGANPMATPPVTTTYTVVGTDANGCTSSASTVVAVNALPIAPAMPIVTICTGESATLIPPVQIGTNRWFTAAGGGTLLSSSPSYTTPVLTTAGTFRFFLEVVDVNGCVSAARSEAQVIVVSPSTPPPPITGDIAVCSNSFHTYSIPAIPNVTYTWTGIPTGASIVSGQGTNQIEINWGAARSGTATITVTPTLPCGLGAPRSLTITISEPPARPLAVTGQNQVCIGGTQTYQVTTRPGETYTWSITPAGPALNPVVGNQTTITWNTTGVYSLSVRAQNLCGTSPTQTIAVFVNAPVTADAGADVSTCGTVAVLTGNSPTPGTGTWRFVSGPIPPRVIQSGRTAFVSGLTLTGVYEFVWDINNGNCPPSSDVVTVTKLVAPVQPSILQPTQTVCDQAIANIAFVPATDGTGVWSFVSGPVTAAIDANGGVQGMSDPGRYRFRYTVTNACGTAFAEAEVTRENPPPTPFAGADQTVCENPFALLIGSLPPTGYVPEWQFINGPAQANVTTFGRYGSVVNMSAPGIYSFQYTLKSATGVCPPASSVVKITRVPAPTVANITGPTSVCGTDAILRGNIPVHGTPTWSFISGPMTPNFNPQNETIAITDMNLPGKYVFRWTIVSPPCFPSSFDHTIDVSPGTVGGTVQGGGTFCGLENGGNLKLTGYQGQIIGWEMADNPGFSGAVLTANTSDLQGFTNLTKTTYFRALVKQGSCPAAYSSVAVVEVIPSVISLNAGPDQTICGTSAVINAIASPANVNLSWSIVSQPQSASANLSFSGNSATLTDLGSGLTAVLVVASTSCGNSSDIVLINAADNVTGGNITGSTTVCAGQNGGTLNLTGHFGQILRWESSTNAWLSVNTLNNTTTQQGFTNLTQTTWFRAVIGGASCPERNSAEALIVVNPKPTAFAGPDISVCTDNFTATGNNVPNATMTWTQMGGPATITPPVSGSVLSLSNIATPGTYTFEYRVSVPGCADAVDFLNATVGQNANVGTVTSDATFCGSAGSGTLQLTGFVGSVLRWESSTNGWVTVNVHNNPTPNFTYFNLTQTTQFRAVVATPGCPVQVSNHVTIYINQPPTQAVAPSRIDICDNQVTLMGNPPSVGTAVWRFVFGPANPTVTGAGATAFVTGMTATGSYLFEYEISNAPCPKSVVQTIVTVSTPVTPGALTANQSVCSGTNSGTLTLAQAAGTVLHWETSPDNFVNITTVARTTTTFPFQNLTTTTQFRAIVKNGGCAPVPSNSVTVTVFQPTVGGTLSGAATVCSDGNSGTLNLSGHVGDVVEWQSSTDNVNFTPVPNVTASLNYTNLTQTTWYRVRVKSGSCAEAFSTKVRIQVDQLPNGGTVSQNATVCAGNNTGTLTLTGHTGTVVRWEFSENGIDYSPILNPTTQQGYQNLTVSRQYRAVLRNGVCPEVFSSVALITVNAPPAAGTIASPTTVCAGTNGGTLTLSGNGAPVVRWESTTDGFTFSTIANTGLTHNWSNLTTTTSFRTVISDGVCPPVISALVTITVDQPPVPGMVMSDQTVCISNPTGTLTLTGQTGTVVRWEQSTDGGANYTPITHTGTTYAFSALTTTTHFRAQVARGACAEQPSTAARVQVDPLTVAGTITGEESSCNSPITRTLSLTGNVGDVVAWQSSTDGVNFTNLPTQGNSMEYTTTSVRTWYRAIVRSGVCQPETTATVSVQNFAPSAGGTLDAAPQVVCNGQNNGTLTLSGQVGTIVRWEQSIDGGQTFTTIANTATTLGFSNLTLTTQYRVVVANGVCPPALSSVATVQVLAALQITTSEASGCSGGNSLQAVAANASGTVTYSIVPAVAVPNTTGLFQNVPVGAYTVNAVDANGCAGSAQVSVTGTQTTPQLTVINNVTTSSAVVQWVPVSGAQTYTLRYRIVGSPTWTTQSNLTTTFRFINGLQQNSRYEVEVAYRCPNADLSAFSTGPLREFTTLPIAATLCASSGMISPPGGVYVDQQTFNSARVNWTGFADAAGYIVSWGVANTNPLAWPQAVVCHPQQNFILTGLTPGGVYQVRVRTNCTNCTTASQTSDKRSDWTILVNFSTNSFREAAPVRTGELAVEVYPNPNRGLFWTRFELTESASVNLKLSDATGREVWSQRSDLNAGEHELPVELQNQAAGVYILEVQAGRQTRVVKVVLQ